MSDEAPLNYVESSIFEESLKEIVNDISWNVFTKIENNKTFLEIETNICYIVENIWGKSNYPQNILRQSFEVNSCSISKLKTGDTRISFTGNFGMYEKLYGVNMFSEQLIFSAVERKLSKSQKPKCDLGIKQLKLDVDTDKEIYKISFILCKK